jgi:hypothetical protein
MFPYGGLRIDDPAELRGSNTLGELASALDLLSQNHRLEALPAIERELSVYFDGFSSDDLEEPSFTSYSLKYSQNANVWTAYVFRYYRTTGLLWREGIRENKLIHKGAELLPVLDSGSLDGRVIEGNVLLFLRQIQR